MASAAKKASRSTNEGAVGTYIHAGGKIGVLLELNCESDFVARTDDFQELLKDIAMHIAAVDPRYVGKDEVTEADIEREKEIYRAQAAATGKPANIIEKMLEGKMSQVLRGGLPARAALHQGAVADHRAAHRAEGRQARREHLASAASPASRSATRLHGRFGQDHRCGRASSLSTSPYPTSKEPGTIVPGSLSLQIYSTQARLPVTSRNSHVRMTAPRNATKML